MRTELTAPLILEFIVCEATPAAQVKLFQRSRIKRCVCARCMLSLQLADDARNHTFLGIKALSIIGLIAVPFFITMGLVAVGFAAGAHGLSGIMTYAGTARTMSFGSAVTLVIACSCRRLAP
jgi:hypothetical protein